MKVKPAKPAAGLSIGNAFEIATLELLGYERYASTHTVLEGERFAFSDTKKPPEPEPTKGHSVYVTNAEGKVARLSLTPLHELDLYCEFEFRLAPIETEIDFSKPRNFEHEFASELARIIQLMNSRLALWTKRVDVA